MVAEFKPFSLSETLKVNDTLSSKVATYREALRRFAAVSALEEFEKNNDLDATLLRLEEANNLAKIKDMLKRQELSRESVADAIKNHTAISNAVESIKKKFNWSKDSAEIENAIKEFKSNREKLNWVDLEMKKMDHLKFSLSDMKIAADLANKKLTSGK